MKKLFTLLAACVFAAAMLFASLTFTGCKRDKREIRLSEVTHSVFYAPLYIAINNGYFTELDINLKLSNAGGADKVMTAITGKTADIGLMGPEATVYCHVNGQRNYPVIFGQLTRCDGSFLVGRNPEPDFKWSDLEGKHILAGRKGGVPAMTLQYVIENTGGLSLDKLNFDTNVAFDLMAGAFEGDTKYDYCTMFEPVASDCISRGKGYIVASVGAASGEVPYTAFSASKSYLENNKELTADFLKAIKMGYEFMRDNTPEKVAEALSPSFPGSSKESLAAAMRSYLEIGAWGDNFVLSKASFEKLQDIMENSGNLTSRADYSVAVDNSIANAL